MPWVKEVLEMVGFKVQKEDIPVVGSQTNNNSKLGG